ncbi:hypothetical protein Pcinc_026420 [Petrolisthes cinctipes]|uniref:Uncharacterized protein n=1 Tax=Petrolisthes cinctipes TaxID=88211 RepID=A0AAE1F6Z2_PETCI|nr:hypothetical protein Pcinc_026420 [Petrolisthes cinctipes]
MDSSLLKSMLESQERAHKAAMEMMVKQMNDQIKKLEGKVSDLTVSLEFTQQEVDELKAEIKEQTKSSQEKMKQLEERINYQEDYSRKKNVRISGVEERDGNETWEQLVKTVTSLLQDKLQLEGLELERAHRVGARRDAKPRTIVARFSRYCDREAVMRKARGVVEVQVTGTWSDGNEEGFPSLPTPRSGASRLLSHSASGASPQRQLLYSYGAHRSSMVCRSTEHRATGVAIQPDRELLGPNCECAGAGPGEDQAFASGRCDAGLETISTSSTRRAKQGDIDA